MKISKKIVKNRKIYDFLKMKSYRINIRYNFVKKIVSYVYDMEKSAIAAAVLTRSKY